MSDAPAPHAPTPPAADPPAAPPRRRRSCLGRLFGVLVALAFLVLAAGIAVVAVSPALRWSAKAIVQPPDDASAWAFIPDGQPIIAALDVESLLRSPLARSLRPDLERAAHAQGFDLGLAERNAHLLLLTSDGRGFASGAASGPRLSPLLLPRFDPRWRLTGSPDRPDVTDGSTVIRPLQPGLVAHAVSETGQDATVALEAALRQAAVRSQSPLPLDGASFAVLVQPDAALRRRMVASVPREAAGHVAAIERIEARATADLTLDATLRVTMQREEAAVALAGALHQLDQILSSGLASFLVPFLGPDAAMLSRIPPFDVERDGRDVIVTLQATEQHLRDLLAEIH